MKTIFKEYESTINGKENDLLSFKGGIAFLFVANNIKYIQNCTLV